MRMWMVDPGTMCRKHLLGEHVETHMFVGAIARGKNLSGYVTNKLVDSARLQERHDHLVQEMRRRGYNHNSPLHYEDVLGLGQVDSQLSDADLRGRCADCRARRI